MSIPRLSSAVLAVTLVGCSSSGSDPCNALAAAAEQFNTQLEPCVGAFLDAGVAVSSFDAGGFLAVCEAAYNGSACTADRSALSSSSGAILDCESALPACNPSDAGVFYDAFSSCPDARIV